MARPKGEKERILERRQWVMVEKRRGHSLDHIYMAWNSHVEAVLMDDPDYPIEEAGRSTIARDIKESLRIATEELNLATNEWRQLHIERIEQVISGKNFQERLDNGDLRTIDTFDRLMDKMIKLTGAYMPVKIAQTDVTGEKDKVSLSPEERKAQLDKLLERAEIRRRTQEDNTTMSA